MRQPGILNFAKPDNLFRALFVGLIALAVTIAGAILMKSSVEKEKDAEFIAFCDDIAIKIEVRLNAQSQLLRCGAAFFAASDTVRRVDWHIFYRNSFIEKNLPGIHGFGYTVFIPPDRLQVHINKVRAEGFPDYTVKPAGIRDAYSSIVYLEPFTGSNLRAFGYDMFSEPVRRKAMEAARDSDKAFITGKVTLVQETSQGVQAGTLMYVPVYRQGAPVETVAQRRLALKGWVYSPYRMNDLMHGILGRLELAPEKRIHMQIYDGDIITPEAILFDSQQNGDHKQDSRSYIHRVFFNGKMWSLKYTQSDAIHLYFNIKVILVFISGLIISILLFILALSLFNTQQSAEQIAGKLTAEIEKANERLSLAVRAGGVGIWDWDLVANELIWDDQMYTLYGITSDRFKGAYQSWLDGLHPDDRERGHHEIEACLSGEKDFDTEFRVCWPDGSVHVLRAMATVQRNEEGRPLNVIGTNWDITDQKKREEALLNAKMEADYASHSKSEFLSRVSHELRTPLNAILGFAQLLDIGALSVSQKKAVQQILVSGKKLLEMINNVLDISSMDAGVLDVNLERLNISEILPGVLDEIKPMAFEKRVTIQLADSLFEEGAVLADRIRFRQVFYNLLSNAVKFNKEGGEVTIGSERVTRMDAGDYIRYSLTDTGIGIRRENLKNLFMPFERVEPDQIDYSGRGLGLAVLKKIVLAMNGTYGVESTYGEGSTFWFELPCA